MFFEIKFYTSNETGRIMVASFPVISKDLIGACVDFVDDNFFSTFHTCEVVTNYELLKSYDTPIERTRVDLS